MGESSNPYAKERGIRLIAAKLASIPDSMSWVIERYKEIEKVDDSAVQRLLGVSENAYYHLALCNRPRSDLFKSDIESLAEHIGIEERSLLALVRRVEALEAFRYYTAAGGGQVVAAARDVAEEQESYKAELKESETSPSEPDDEQ
jgi:hypothetical protein